VYILSANANNFQNLVFSSDADWEVTARFNGEEPLAADWTPLSVAPLMDDDLNVDLPVGDFPCLESHVPVFSVRAKKALEGLLTSSGELLPLICEDGDEYFAFNATRLVDCLDESASEISRFKSRRIMEIKKHVFKRNCLEGLSIFKLKQTPLLHVYVTDAFLLAVAEAGLKGFHFDLVWEG
jgi:hypothetical protein